MFVHKQEVEGEVRRQRIRAESVRRDFPAARVEAARLEDVVDQRRDQTLV